MWRWLKKILGIKPCAPYRVLEIRHKQDFRKVLITGARGMHLVAELPQAGFGQGFSLVAKHQAVDHAHFDELWRYYSRIPDTAVWESDGKKFKGG